MDALDKFEEYLKQDYSNANSAIQVQGLASIAACETGKVRVVVNGSGSELERTACGKWYKVEITILHGTELIRNHWLHARNSAGTGTTSTTWQTVWGMWKAAIYNMKESSVFRDLTLSLPRVITYSVTKNTQYEELGFS